MRESVVYQLHKFSDGFVSRCHDFKGVDKVLLDMFYTSRFKVVIIGVQPLVEPNASRKKYDDKKHFD